MAQNHPLIGLYVVIEVHLVQVIEEVDIQFESIVSPGAKFEEAGLLIEWEMGDVYHTGRLEDGLRDPEHRAVARHDGERFAVLLEPVVRAVRKTPSVRGISHIKLQ